MLRVIYMLYEQSCSIGIAIHWGITCPLILGRSPIQISCIMWAPQYFTFCVAR